MTKYLNYNKVLFIGDHIDESLFMYKNIVIENACNDILTNIILKINEGYNVIICKGFVNEITEEYTKNIYDIYGASLFNYELLLMKEICNIINNCPIIFIKSTVENYTVSQAVKHEMLHVSDKYYDDIYLKNGFKIINIEKYKKKLYYDGVGNTDDQYDYYNLIMLFINNNIFEKAILYDFHMYEMHIINKIHKMSNYKMICWQDDLHAFGYNKVDNIFEHSSAYVIPELDDVTSIITPCAQYFRNLHMDSYSSKSKELFYFFDDRMYSNISIHNYNNRIDQVILSGEINFRYKTRTEFLELSKTNEFKNIIHHYKHPGYNSNTSEYSKKTGLNFYIALSNYKAAFVGLLTFPLNYIVAKITEVLMCGCLGFFEKSPLLYTQLGLIEFVHYVPCTDENMNLITDPLFYTTWMSSKKGEIIALCGANYIREQFGIKGLYDRINYYKSIL